MGDAERIFRGRAAQTLAAGHLPRGVSREHLGYYLDEFTFRYNRRTSRARGLLFYRLLEQGVRTGHTPTAEFFLGAGRGPRRKAPNHPSRNHSM